MNSAVPFPVSLPRMQEDDQMVVDQYKYDGVRWGAFDVGVPLIMPLLGLRSYQIVELQFDFKAPRETAMTVNQPWPSLGAGGCDVARRLPTHALPSLILQRIGVHDPTSSLSQGPPVHPFPPVPPPRAGLNPF